MSPLERKAVDGAGSSAAVAGGQPGVAAIPDDPVFAEPWQAQAFAMTVALHERGLFTWGEWGQALAAQIGDGNTAADGSDYYRHWVSALERILAVKAVAKPIELEAMADAWHRAAHATPHGEPIRIENDPLRKTGRMSTDSSERREE